MKARIRDVLSFHSHRCLVSLELDAAAASVEEFKDQDLEVQFKRYRAHRSREANAMLWACLGEMATALRVDKWTLYLKMLKDYGKYTYILVKPEAVEAMKKQWRETEVIGEGELENGQKMVQLLCYFGSSTYDSKEFSVLLDGVVYEMKQLGLQPPPNEEMKATIERLKKHEVH